MELKRKDFTWRSGREHPSLTKLDQFVLSTDGEDVFPASIQRPSSATSNHAPIASDYNIKLHWSKIFRFESRRGKVPNFDDVVKAELRPIRGGNNSTARWVENARKLCLVLRI